MVKHYMNHVTELGDDEIKQAIVEWANKNIPQKWGIQYNIGDISYIRADSMFNTITVTLNRTVD